MFKRVNILDNYASKDCCRAVSAQAILASLFARAQVTTKLFFRSNSHLNQSASLPVRFSSVLRYTRAHWTSNSLILLFPHILMPCRVVLPPVLYWHVTRPVAAAKSRLLPYCFLSPSWVERRLAVNGPTQGMESKCWPASSLSSDHSS